MPIFTKWYGEWRSYFYSEESSKLCVEGVFSSTTQLENRYFLKRKVDAFTIRRKTEQTGQSWPRYFHRLSGRTRSGVVRLLKRCGENTVLTQAWTGQCCPQGPPRPQPGQPGEETWNVQSTGNESIPREILWESWGAGSGRACVQESGSLGVWVSEEPLLTVLEKMDKHLQCHSPKVSKAGPVCLAAASPLDVSWRWRIPRRGHLGIWTSRDV